MFGQTPPWLVDRLFRNLLIDSSGNTHRAEFSIDKLYAPESSSGRLGLVEMRAFEMPPHARDEPRAASACCAASSRNSGRSLTKTTSSAGARTSTTAGCCRIFAKPISRMSSAICAMPVIRSSPNGSRRILNFVSRASAIWSSAICRSNSAPRSNRGTCSAKNPAAAARCVTWTARVERLQVKARGLVGRPLRHHLQRPSRAVASHRHQRRRRRRRALSRVAAADCLQPTIDSHAPLRFDLVDTWNQRSLGGCTYHVAHPGGRSYDTFPVNSYEAESRRLARFFRHGHSRAK